MALASITENTSTLSTLSPFVAAKVVDIVQQS